MNKMATVHFKMKCTEFFLYRVKFNNRIYGTQILIYTVDYHEQLNRAALIRIDFFFFLNYIVIQQRYHVHFVCPDI